MIKIWNGGQEHGWQWMVTAHALPIVLGFELYFGVNTLFCLNINLLFAGFEIRYEK